MINNRLPRHPLVAKGYPSIGCAPCTSPVKPGEDPRAGRWRGSAKTECGIHFIDGKPVRLGKETAA
jgi:phosphoadenosine phosphosulfate reductase